MPERREPTMDPHDEEVDHVRGPSTGRLGADIADSARGELATDVAAKREPANIQEVEIRTGKLAW